MAWSPDGKFIAVGESRGIIIFLTPDGQLIRRGIRLDPNAVPQSLAFSPDGNRLAVVCKESIAVYLVSGRKRLWYSGPKKVTARPKMLFRNVFFSSDNSELIVTQYRRHHKQFLLAYSSATGEKLRERFVSTSIPTIMTASPDRQTIAYVAGNFRIAMCKTSTFEPLIESSSEWNEDLISGDRNFPVDLSASPDGRRLLVVGANAVVLWDINSGKQIWSRKWKSWICEAVWAPHGKWITMVRGADPDDDVATAAVLTLEPTTGNTLKEFPLDGRSSGPVVGLSGDRVVACDSQSAYLYSGTGERLWKRTLVDGHTELCNIAIDPSGKLLGIVRRLSGASNMPDLEYSQGSIFLLDLAMGYQRLELLSTTTPQTIAFSPDGLKLIASTTNHPRRRGSLQALVQSWDVATGKIEDNSSIPNEGQTDYVVRLEDACKLATEYALVSSSQLIVYGIMAVSPDRRRVLIQKPIEYTEPEYTEPEHDSVPIWPTRLVLWDLIENREVMRWIFPGGLWDCAILPDGRMATLNRNGTIFVLRTPDSGPAKTGP
jgi:WD40 repeat protein